MADQNYSKVHISAVIPPIVDFFSVYQYYNLRYNPSAPFVRSGFVVSYRIRSAMKTTAPRTAPHLTYIQGIGIPNKASFEILAMNTGLN